MNYDPYMVVTMSVGGVGQVEQWTLKMMMGIVQWGRGVMNYDPYM